MTDPIVKQALLGLCDVMKQLTQFTEQIRVKLNNLEERVALLEYTACSTEKSYE